MDHILSLQPNEVRIRVILYVIETEAKGRRINLHITNLAKNVSSLLLSLLYSLRLFFLVIPSCFLLVVRKKRKRKRKKKKEKRKKKKEKEKETDCNT